MGAVRTEEDMPMWLSWIIVGTINEHWWNADEVDIESCGPCAALNEMPREVLENAVIRYEVECGSSHYYWDSKNRTFRAGVDFSKPADQEALITDYERDQHQEESIQ